MLTLFNQREHPMKRKTSLLSALLLLLIAASTSAQQATPSPSPDASILTVDSILTYRTRLLGPIQWQENGNGYLALEPSANKKEFVDIVRYDALSGERTIKVPAEKLIAPGASSPLLVEEFVFTPDEQ